MTDARVRQLRMTATELRRMADQLNREADALEAQLSDRPLLGGRDLVDAAVEVLGQRGASGPYARGVHYIELAAAAEAATGRRIRGVKPLDTLLANLSRDPRVECVQERSGRYRLRGTTT